MPCFNWNRLNLSTDDQTHKIKLSLMLRAFKYRDTMINIAAVFVSVKSLN